MSQIVKTNRRVDQGKSNAVFSLICAHSNWQLLRLLIPWLSLCLSSLPTLTSLSTKSANDSAPIIFSGNCSRYVMEAFSSFWVKDIEPDSGFSMSRSNFANVVFPDPFEPVIPNDRKLSICRLKPLNKFLFPL